MARDGGKVRGRLLGLLIWGSFTWRIGSVLLDEVCVRGVEMAAEGTSEVLLGNLTKCKVASLLTTGAAATASAPLDEAAIAAVLKADALLAQRGLDGSFPAQYGKLLRGGGNVVTAHESGASMRAAGFVAVSQERGYVWWRRRPEAMSKFGPAGLKVSIQTPTDGEVLAAHDAAVVSVAVDVPRVDLVSLLPTPRLLLAADPAAEAPLAVDLPASSPVRFTLRDVPAGSHLLTASLAYGQHVRVVPDASASAMVDVVPTALVPQSSVPSSSSSRQSTTPFGDQRRSYSSTPLPGDSFTAPGPGGLGCARLKAAKLSSALSSSSSAAAAAAAGSSSSSSKAERYAFRRKMRIAFADAVPTRLVDGQRRVWLQRCAHWTQHDVSYLLLYDATSPVVPEDAPIRVALKKAGVRSNAVAAPWHVSTGSSRDDATALNLKAAVGCAKYGGDQPSSSSSSGLKNESNRSFLGARKAWLTYLSQSVDVLFAHAAPGPGGPAGDAARLACLSRLAFDAGVPVRILELPALPSPDLLAWRPQVVPTTTTTASVEAVVVPSHYAASFVRKALQRTHISGALASPETPVVVLQPGVDEAWFRAGSNRRVSFGKEPRRKKTAVWVGRLDADKSPMLFVGACALLQRHYPLECLVVGDGPLDAPLRARARRSALSSSSAQNETTRFLGFFDGDGLADVVSRADVLVSTSVFPETFGLAPLEAAAAGVAVVAFAVAGMTEHLCDGANALVPTSPTPSALAATIRRLLDDSGQADALGKTGALGAATHFKTADAVDRAALLVDRLYAVRRSSQQTSCNATQSCSASENHLDRLGRPRLAPVYDHNSFLADLAVLDPHDSLFGP